MAMSKDMMSFTYGDSRKASDELTIRTFQMGCSFDAHLSAVCDEYPGSQRLRFDICSFDEVIRYLTLWKCLGEGNRVVRKRQL